MDKIYYKELIEKYFDGNITDAEIKELSDWIKNDRHLQNWWEEEFSKSDAGINPVLRDKLFARIKERVLQLHFINKKGNQKRNYLIVMLHQLLTHKFHRQR